MSFSIDEDITTLAIAHCNYSLEIGKGTIVEYDFEGFQRQLYQKFIRGRPILITKVGIIFLNTLKITRNQGFMAHLIDLICLSALLNLGSGCGSGCSRERMLSGADAGVDALGSGCARGFLSL